MNDKFARQDAQYQLPYHYLVSLDRVQVGKVMDTGLEYYCYLRQAMDLVESQPYQTLVDIGCGDGRLMSHLAPQHKERKYHGVDVSERSILLAQGLNYDIENASFFAMDAADLDQQYDVITCVETMEHISDDLMPSFTQSLFDRLASGGRLVVTVPSVVIPLQKKHYRHYDIELLDSQLHQFTRTHVQYAMKTGWLRNLCVRLARKFSMIRPLQNIISMIGEKFLFTATASTGRHVVAVYTK